MAGESEKDLPVAEKPDSPAAAVADSKPKKDLKKKKHGLISRIWRGLFGSGKDDFQSRLEKIAKEEAAILARVRKRAQSSRRIKMNLIILTLFIEVFAVAYAIITASSVEDWKKRAFRVLPMFAWPGSMIAVYSAYVSCINIFERKDQKNLERLRTERQSKIDELKEKTNYYITQQLIQRYDTDPAAKAAAATVLASKLGADSGLKFNMGEDSKLHTATGKSNDVEFAQSRGLRNRRQPSQSSSTRSDSSPHHPDTMALQQIEAEIAEHGQPVYVNHYEPGQGELNPASGGWLGRLTAMLVGDDPTQCYALICGNCHMHNGLATKEDYPHLTYICPHCRAVNGPRNKDTAHSSGSSTPNTVISTLTDNGKSMSTNTGQSPKKGPLDNVISENQEASPLVTEESSETMVASED